MERKSQVQIPKDLLLALFQYHLAGNEEYLPEIEKALMEKLDSMVKRQLYTTFKTAPTEEEREKARQEYLDKCGIKHNFRQLDALLYAKDGTLEEVLEELYPEQ